MQSTKFKLIQSNKCSGLSNFRNNAIPKMYTNTIKGGNGEDDPIIVDDDGNIIITEDCVDL